jgi:hypothetical protein
VAQKPGVGLAHFPSVAPTYGNPSINQYNYNVVKILALQLKQERGIPSLLF